MAYTYHGTNDLIALPNRVVQTYPSGLVRIERSFVCKKSQVAKYRNTLKVNEPMPLDSGSPANSGVYIFPDPQEIVRDDGFVEFRVTAYGIISELSSLNPIIATARGEFYNVKDEYNKDTNEIIRSEFYLPSINEIYTFLGVLSSSQKFNPLTTQPLVEDPLLISIGTGQRLFNKYSFQENALTIDGTTYALEKSTSVQMRLEAYSSTNFGQFTEYTVTWKAQAIVSEIYI